MALKKSGDGETCTDQVITGDHSIFFFFAWIKQEQRRIRGGSMLGPVQEPGAAFIIALQPLYGHSCRLHNSWTGFSSSPSSLRSHGIDQHVCSDSDVRTPFMALQIWNRSRSVFLWERPKVSKSLWKSEDQCGPNGEVALTDFYLFVRGKCFNFTSDLFLLRSVVESISAVSTSSKPVLWRWNEETLTFVFSFHLFGFVDLSRFNTILLKVSFDIFDL